jgi:uncharacterized protein YgiM (DUF1202 family)
MPTQKDRLYKKAHWLRRHWVLLTAVAIAFTLLLAGQPLLSSQPLLAADAQPDINQGTVPNPTPRPGVTETSNNTTGAAVTLTPAAPAAGDAAALAAASTSGLTAVVDVLTLNMRQGPGTTFPVVGKLAQGATVTVEARNSAGDWWLICCIPNSESRGWVSAALIVPNFTAEQAAALPVSDSAVTAESLAATSAATTTTTIAATPVPGSLPGSVAGVNLNVRQGPGTDQPVVGKLRAADAVSVLGRNAAGDWLYICCAGTPLTNGWVSAQFITPTFAASDLAEVTGAPAATTDVGAAATTGGLSLEIAQEPPFAVQGREVALIYTVRNGGSADLADVVLRSELPGPLTLVGASAAGGTVTQQDAPLVEITWPVLAAGGSATATVRVRVASDVPNGTTFPNLATVTGGGESAVNGITVGMPPALLPEFW